MCSSHTRKEHPVRPHKIALCCFPCSLFFLTGIIQGILAPRLGSVLSWPVYVTVPQPVYVWCFLSSNKFRGEAFNSVFMEFGSSAVKACTVQTVVNPLAVGLAAQRISAFQLKLAWRQLAPLNLLTTCIENPQIVQRGYLRVVGDRSQLKFLWRSKFLFMPFG